MEDGVGELAAEEKAAISDRGGAVPDEVDPAPPLDFDVEPGFQDGPEGFRDSVGHARQYIFGNGSPVCISLKPALPEVLQNPPSPRDGRRSSSRSRETRTPHRRPSAEVCSSCDKPPAAALPRPSA